MKNNEKARGHSPGFFRFPWRESGRGLVDWGQSEVRSVAKFQRWIDPQGLTLLEGWARDGLTDEQIATVAEEHLTGTILQERIDNAQVKRSEKLDGIDAGTFYTSYNEKIEALMAADEAADGTDGEGQESADGAQGADEPADGGTEPAAE